MDASNGIFSPKPQENVNFEPIAHDKTNKLYDQIQSIQNKIKTLCIDEFKKIESNANTEGKPVIDLHQKLKACIDSVDEDPAFKSILNKQKTLINDIFTNKNSADLKNTLLNELNESVNEIEGLLIDKIKTHQNISKNGLNHLTTQSSSVTQQPQIKQIDVLNQTTDKTGTGAENCGYHSLKNALCLMTALFSEKHDSNSFVDPKLFNVFYNHYAAPLLTDRQKGHKDASDPLLRQMISMFVSDPSPPPALLPFQKVLNNHQRDLGIYTLLPTNNEIGLRLGVMDEAGFMDAKKIFNFSQQKEPSVLICPVGNVNTNHWYTLAIVKKEGGAIDFFGCDSLESNQRGIASPLGKVCSLFESTLSNPQEFIEQSLSSFVEGFDRYGDWLNAEGVPDTEESKASLIELAKKPSQFTSNLCTRIGKYVGTKLAEFFRYQQGFTDAKSRKIGEFQCKRALYKLD